MRNVLAKICRESQNTFYVQYIYVQYIYVQYIFTENRTVYEITWKNMVEPDRPHATMVTRTRLNVTLYVH